MRNGGAFLILVSIAGVAIAAAQSEAPPVAKAPPDEKKICQSVVSADIGAKPYQLCQTKAEWDAKKAEDAKDATRMVCRYEEMPGTRFRSAKICQPKSAWDEARRLDREAVEQIQRSVCVAGGGC